MNSLPLLPSDIAIWLERWTLVPDGDLLTTRSSWVLPVRRQDSPAMLKVARIPDEEAGFRLLTWWNGQGAARVFESKEFDDNHTAVDYRMDISLPILVKAIA